MLALDVKYLGQALKASEDELEADKHEDGAMPSPRDNGSGRHANDTPVFDFSNTFASGTPESWRWRILTPQANNSWITYRLNGALPKIDYIKWVASPSRDTSAGSVEEEIDTLRIVRDSAGVPRAGEHSERQWLSRGYDDTTGQHYISIRIQSWLQNIRDQPGRVGRQARNGVGEVGSDTSYTGRPGDYMRLKIKWSRQEVFLREGISTTGLFTVAESPDKEPVKGKWSQEAVSQFNWTQDRGTEESMPMAIPNPFGGGIATSTDTPPTPPFPSSDLFPDPLPSPSPSSTSPSPTVDTGPYQTDDDTADASSISTGAIAGIAAGCAIAVILLFTAVWFLVARHRRRRRHRPPQQESPSNDKATALMDDRRMSTALVAQSVQSPQSPQSPNFAHLSPVVPIRPRQQNEDSPRAATASFAERGMTSEERRRWEEEERQLDDEIARKNKSL
ncbi:hypothetical protein E4U17_004032 [Claviceps sp. LM77 group G4]|nr:hypothetical protein E4U17_004032 [Claviceps sp. LM77 group G4]